MLPIFWYFGPRRNQNESCNIFTPKSPARDSDPAIVDDGVPRSHFARRVYALRNVKPKEKMVKRKLLKEGKKYSDVGSVEIDFKMC